MSTTVYTSSRVDPVSGAPMRPDRTAAQRLREDAFARISRVRGLAIIAAGALTAVIAGVVSAVAPGHTLGSKKAVHAAAAHSSVRTRIAARMPPLATPGELGLQGPGAAPQSVPQPQSAAPQQAAPSPSPAASSPSPAVSGGS